MSWTLKQIETFVWVAKLGSFRRTAERLGTTQPNISVRIADLEKEFGAKLFDRDAGSVALTQTGDVLLRYAERVLSASEELSAQSSRAGEEPGLLRLGATELVAQTWLLDYLRALKAEYQNVDVELTVDLSVNLRGSLVDRSLDLAFLNGPISDFNIDNLDLGQVPLVWVAAPTIPPPLRRIEHLARHTILTHARHTRPYVEVATHFRDHWIGRAKIVSSSSLAACVQMTIAGLGVATLPEPLVREHVSAGDLVETGYPWTPAPLAFTASYGHTPASRMVRRAAEIACEVARRRT
ncbi:LysR family transcriptional regulator [Pikeienuella sp. HZG-20]|uniref:LysR family transcriptional regulator n=1 Tax=Paludibacillus litoralis TaxID=3133267 RepID=UPI0030EF8117